MLLMLLIANAIAPTSSAHPLYSEDDTTEVNISKQVEVTADQTIILVVRNPKKLPVTWYYTSMIDGRDVEISKEDERYHIERTDSNNERLVIEDSGMKYDGYVFVVKMKMSHSVLRVAWSITVNSVEETKERQAAGLI